jgi:hypothetical protein
MSRKFALVVMIYYIHVKIRFEKALVRVGQEAVGEHTTGVRRGIGGLQPLLLARASTGLSGRCPGGLRRSQCPRGSLRWPVFR